MKTKTRTYVTQPYLPELKEFMPYLEEIWHTRQLTNRGPFLHEFERALEKFLGVEHVVALSNATLALMLALRALEVQGEIITTPYSFIATTHSIAWNGLTPVFVDIEAKTGNMDAGRIREAITDKTRAIMPVHIYGNPCDVEEIERIAEEYNLKVIYDAAHAFAVKHQGKSVLLRGDMSVLSFHATKCFTTFEGGAVICRDEEMKSKLHLLQNFGITDETTVICTGLNAKLDEFRAALGIIQLRHFEKSVLMRKRIADIYGQGLRDMGHIRIIRPSTDNYAYYPVVISCEGGESLRDRVFQELKNRSIFTRKYFYPIISNFPVYSHLPSAAPENLPVANKMGDEILCLPIYADMPESVAHLVVSVIKSVVCGT